jgi:hypothetical protein
MDESMDSVFIAGAVVGAVLVATLLVVPVLRYIVLIVATSVIVAIYLHGGIPGLILYVYGMQIEITNKPVFSLGTIAGALLVTLFRLGKRERRVES